MRLSQKISAQVTNLERRMDRQSKQVDNKLTSVQESMKLMQEQLGKVIAANPRHSSTPLGPFAELVHPLSAHHSGMPRGSRMPVTKERATRQAFMQWNDNTRDAQQLATAMMRWRQPEMVASFERWYANARGHLLRNTSSLSRLSRGSSISGRNTFLQLDEVENGQRRPSLAA